MRKIYLLLCALFLGLLAISQNSANYAFSTGTNGSLSQDMNGNAVSMSTGTTQLIAAGSDDANSTATSISFDFWFYGNRFTQFSATSNGLVGLGSTPAPSAGSSSNLVPYQIAGGSVASPKLGAMVADLSVSSTGKVHYKVVGTTPNRCLVIEFLNMALAYSSTAVDGTYQVRLYESTGVIEYVYGAMNRNTGTSAYTANFSIGFSTGTAAGTSASITTSTQSVSYDAAFATNTYPTGAIADLTSAADGSRRYYRFASPQPIAPAGLNFTAVGSTVMTLNWTDNATNEMAYAVYRSSDGGATFGFVGQVAANTTTYSASSLAPNTLYNWRVYAISEGAFSTSLGGAQSTTAAGNITSNGTGGGLWSATTTWAGGLVPGAGDLVTIKNGDNVVIDAAAAAYSLTIGEGSSGSLQFETATARTLSVSQNLLVNTGASFTTPPSGTVTTHMISVGGNLTNNSILDLSTNANTAGASLSFTGDGNSLFSGTGTTSNLYSLSLAKASLSVIVELNLPAFSVRGLSTNATGALLTSGGGTGTLKISGTNSFSGTLWSTASYTIPATMGLWLNNANFTVNGLAGSATNNGQFRLTAGTYNVGTAINNSIGAGAGASFVIEGGTLNVAGRFLTANAIAYNQSGGNVNVATVGNNGTSNGSFSLSAGTFTMSGGSITLVQINSNATASSRRDFYNVATATITGGTVYFGTGATVGNSGTFDFRAYGYLPNLVIDNTTNNKTLTAGVSGATAGSFIFFGKGALINSGTTFSLGGFAAVFEGNVVNNGTINGNTTSSRLYFGGTAMQTYSGSGVAGTAATPLLSFDVDNPVGLTIDPAVSGVVTNRIILFSGSITNTNKITLGSGGTSTGVIQIGNTTTATPAIGFDTPPVFNLGSGGQTISALRTVNPINLGNFLNPGRVLNNLTIDPNTQTVILNGGNVQVTGTLTLTTGLLDLGGNTLTLGSSPTSRGTLASTVTTLFNGKMKRWFDAAINTGLTGDFPVGISTAQRKARVEFTAAPTTGGSLTAEYLAVAPGNNGLPLNDGGTTVSAMAQNGYWRISSGDGLSGGLYTINLTATGYSNITNPAELRIVKRADASQAWGLEGTHVAGSGVTATRAGVASFSDFAIASDGAVNPLPVTLLSFSGARQGTVNVLRWITVSERDIRHFDVERSEDGGRTWVSVGIVAPQGSASAQKAYSLTDGVYSGATQLYRLRQVDVNGTGKLSQVVMITGGRTTSLTLTRMFPNPASAALFVSLEAPSSETVSLILTDASGRQIKRENKHLSAGSNTLMLSLNGVARGQYFMQVKSENGFTKTLFFIKE